MPFDRLLDLFRRKPRHDTSNQGRHGPVTHVVILDGTMSTLKAGCETNAGLTYNLLKRMRGAELNIYYEAGLQWRDWRSGVDVLLGRGINRQIKRAYGTLAGRYQPGDRIFLIGFSRGAFAVRSLAGVIDRVGLIKRDHATVRAVRQAYRLYRGDQKSPAIEAFHKAYCHDHTEIDTVAVWDTVKALGLTLPVLWRLTAKDHAFHSARLGKSVGAGYQALALHETRSAFWPELWQTRPGYEGHMEQVWFRGIHADVGGQVASNLAARPLSNIPLCWMLDKLEARGLQLPDGWREEFPMDIDAPGISSWTGSGKLFLARSTRVVGADPSEVIHPSVPKDLYPD